MYTAAMELLEDERDGWRPYEALAALSDAELSRATDPAGPGLGWSGRDLIAHMIGWLEAALAVARELAVGERSATYAELERGWSEPGGSDRMNDALHARWRALPMAEVRTRLGEVPGELRGTLTVVPEARWVKDAKMSAFFIGDTIEHYEDHLPVLAAVLALRDPA